MKHQWGEPVRDFVKTERSCSRPGCGIVKVTQHPPEGFPWAEFYRDGEKIAGGDAPTPPCEGKAA
jgi:hypothetical protein